MREQLPVSCEMLSSCCLHVAGSDYIHKHPVFRVWDYKKHTLNFILLLSPLGCLSFDIASFNNRNVSHSLKVSSYTLTLATS